MSERNRKTHILKLYVKYYEDVIKGKKKAEVRKNDRDFLVDDWIYFVKVDSNGTPITKRLSKPFVITHSLELIGINSSMLSIEELK